MTSATVVLRWGDRAGLNDEGYLFALKGKQLEELQRLCGPTPKQPVGIGAIAQRLFSQQYFIGDIVHTIRLGLIGGGIDPTRAKQLIEQYVDGQPLANPLDPNSPLATAQAVVQAAFFGLETLEPERNEEPEPGEAPAPETRDTSTSGPLKPTD